MEENQKASAAQAPSTTAPAACASVYSIDDLAAESKALGTRPECVRAALRQAEGDTFTVEQAKAIVQKFLKKEVK